MLEQSKSTTQEATMKIKYQDSYLEHGCEIYGKLAVVEYYGHITNHEFNSAHRRGGLYEKIDEARTLIKSNHPNAREVLTMPDLVFRID